MTFLSKYQPQLLSVLRIVAGLLFLEHGCSKLLHFPYVPMFDHLTPLLIAAGTIELVGGALIVLGLFSRIAAFVASGEMAVAYWMYHVPHGGLYPVLNEGDAAILFCFVFLYLAASGPGPWAVNQK
ncbi:MAG TPA: DoxX family protein [Rhizomicrobium sp.]|nr:DoxX family protein [Rhizomicrobium sp.]